MIKDITKDFHITPTRAKSVAFDCINEISDLYGDCPEEANAMIKGVRYYLGYLQQAGAFDCECDVTEIYSNGNVVQDR